MVYQCFRNERGVAGSETGDVSCSQSTRPGKTGSGASGSKRNIGLGGRTDGVVHWRIGYPGYRVYNDLVICIQAKTATGTGGYMVNYGVEGKNGKLENLVNCGSGS